MKTRVITMLGILAVVIPCLLLGGIWMRLLVAFIVAVGTYEFSRLSDAEFPMPLVIGLIVVELIGIMLPTEIVMGYVGIIYLFLLSLPIFNENLTPKDSFVCMSFVFFFILIGSTFIRIYNAESRFIWFIIIATYVCDSFAYLCGRQFGKHKLAPRISPNKTVEGSIGGWFFGMIISLLYGYFFINSDHLTSIAIASFFLPIFGQIGDLAFSAIKRSYKIKDFGNLLPGHGGVLDRVDSLLFNIVVFGFIFTLVNL